MPSPNPVTLQGLLFAVLAYGGFFVALLAGAVVLPGKTVMGFRQPNGDRKAYKMVGMSLWVGTHIAIVAGALLLDLSLSPLYREFWSLLIVANLFAVAWSLILLVRGRAKLPAPQRKPLAPCPSSSSFGTARS